jgi:hypothetical protein
MKPTDYEAVRCGMNVSKAIIEGSIHAGIGLENVQMVELEEWLAGQGRPRSDVQMLCIDELAEYANSKNISFPWTNLGFQISPLIASGALKLQIHF